MKTEDREWACDGRSEEKLRDKTTNEHLASEATSTWLIITHIKWVSEWVCINAFVRWLSPSLFLSLAVSIAKQRNSLRSFYTDFYGAYAIIYSFSLEFSFSLPLSLSLSVSLALCLLLVSSLIYIHSFQQTNQLFMIPVCVSCFSSRFANIVLIYLAFFCYRALWLSVGVVAAKSIYASVCGSVYGLFVFSFSKKL